MAVAQSPAMTAHAAGFATVASRARDWAERTPHRVAMREKDLGIWQEYTWAEVWETDRRRRPRTDGARHRTGRSRVDPRRGSPRVGHPRPGHRRRAGHHRRAVSDQPGGRGRVRPERLRRIGPPRRGPGAGRQGAGDRPGRAPAAAHDRPRRAARVPGDDRRPAHVVGRLPRPRPSSPGRPPETARRADGGGGGDGRDDARLHVGDHRPAQGRDAHEQERRVLHRHGDPPARAGSPVGRRTPTTTSSPTSRCAMSPSASSRRGRRWRRVPSSTSPNRSTR